MQSVLVSFSICPYLSPYLQHVDLHLHIFKFTLSLKMALSLDKSFFHIKVVNSSRSFDCSDLRST